jgi:outer membrane protein
MSGPLQDMKAPAGSSRRQVAKRIAGAAWIAGVLLLQAGAASGQTGLIEVYKMALQSDPRYRATLAEVNASSMVLEQARAGFFPTIRYDLDKTETRSDLKSVNFTTPNADPRIRHFPTEAHTLSVTQPLFRRELITRYDQAKSVVKQAQYTGLAAEQDLILRTTAAYLSALAARDSLALAQAEKEAVGKTLELARERLKMGLGTIVNQNDAQARYALTLARETEAQNKMRDAQQALREISGKLLSIERTLKPDFTLFTPEPAIPDRWVETALEQNLILRARREAVDVARQEVEKQRSGFWPSLNLLVNHSRRDTGQTLSNGTFGPQTLVETTEVTVRLSVPIYEGGLTTAVSKEAAFRYQKSQEELEQERRSVERQTRANYDGTFGAAGLVQALKQAVIAQESALEAKEQGFKSGLFPLLQVLDAQRDLYLARRDYAQARYDYLLYRLRLKQSVGILAENDLVDVDAALQ